MAEAEKMASKGRKKNEVPVGAVIIYKGAIVAKAHNLVISTKDPTAHAEILAIRKACQNMASQHLTECDIYVTLEPCAMCGQAIIWSKIKRLYYAIEDEKSGGIVNGAQVAQKRKLEVYGGIKTLANKPLLTEFFRQVRKNKVRFN